LIFLLSFLFLVSICIHIVWIRRSYDQRTGIVSVTNIVSKLLNSQGLMREINADVNLCRICGSLLPGAPIEREQQDPGGGVLNPDQL
jgi:hypothetical protein